MAFNYMTVCQIKLWHFRDAKNIRTPLICFANCYVIDTQQIAPLLRNSRNPGYRPTCSCLAGLRTKTRFAPAQPGFCS